MGCKTPFPGENIEKVSSICRLLNLPSLIKGKASSKIVSYQY